MSAHQPMMLLTGSEGCFDRECEEYYGDDGSELPAVERCSHITEEQVCSFCTKEDGDDFNPVVSWPCAEAS